MRMTVSAANKKAMSKLTAARFVKQLKTYRSDAELKKYERYFPLEKRDGDRFIGVRMGQVFTLAKEFLDMPADEIEKLMESPLHEVRAGAMSIMGQSAKSKNCPETRLKELYDLYLRRHDRVNNWDLVDLAAHHVIGRYLADSADSADSADKPRKVLTYLARSQNEWERRTAILATAHFILKLKETDDTFKIAEILVKDEAEFVAKAVGWMLRAAGGVDRERLLKFLDKHGAEMPRTALRNSIEHLDKEQRKHYLGLKGNS
jgi:3-methyladenine DNA glycosylase AlkD